MIDSIIDLYHGNSVDFKLARQGGVAAVIHKATEGAHFRDSKYLSRKAEAKALGLLWGAYHFSSGEPVPDQVENFLRHARPADDEFIALDWEASSEGADMSLDQARRFVQTIHDEIGRWPCIYGGNVLRSAVGHAADPVLSHCPLWYVRYAASPIGIPTAIWPTYTLWQYTDGDVPQPTPTPGTSGADRSRYQGSLDQLKLDWPFTKRAAGGQPGPGLVHLTTAAA
jgi:lysozyme